MKNTRARLLVGTLGASAATALLVGGVATPASAAGPDPATSYKVEGDDGGTDYCLVHKDGTAVDAKEGGCGDRWFAVKANGDRYTVRDYPRGKCLTRGGGGSVSLSSCGNNADNQQWRLMGNGRLRSGSRHLDVDDNGKLRTVNNPDEDTTTWSFKA